nr:GDSL esterase/lipase At4g10955-like [Ipomoea batatas]GME16085.1 GDSL esterase/lipase At4g10955-like [Ipomoea batatas]
MVVTAGLVKAVSELQKQHQKGGELCLEDVSVSQLWKEYGFDLDANSVLIDPHDGSIFGAIFIRRSSTGAGDPLPKVVIAFRGTMLQKATFKEDMANNWGCIFNGLHESTRVILGLTAVKAILGNVAEDGVWLAGHSLGAAIALAIGRNLVLSMHLYLETYLFNPPMISLLDCNSPIKSGLVGLSSTLDKKLVNMDEILVLSEWIPHLFINEFDWICNDFLTHFESLNEMEFSGGDVEENWMVKMNSFRTLVWNLLGNNKPQPPYLIPSAHLTINSKQPEGSMGSHRLRQWLNPELQQLRHWRFQARV